jgi:hypothetical protein
MRTAFPRAARRARPVAAAATTSTTRRSSPGKAAMPRRVEPSAWCSLSRACGPVPRRIAYEATR